MKRIAFFTSIIVMAGFIGACCTARKSGTEQKGSTSALPGPKVIIYQTTKDYSQLVPIILSEDGKTIESYPDVKDVFYNGVLAYPTKLNKGYWLDNRGIGKNVAFINLTYEEYSKLPKTPLPDALMKMVVDAKPIVRMYNCGLRSTYKNIEEELNSKIDKGDFSGFTLVK
jgi:hypothetical protein